MEKEKTNDYGKGLWKWLWKKKHYRLWEWFIDYRIYRLWEWLWKRKQQVADAHLCNSCDVVIMDLLVDRRCFFLFH